MILTFLSCIFILALQGVILFYLLKFPLSLWFDATLTSAILSGILLCIQVLLSGSIYDLFFMVDFEEMEAAEKKNEEKSGEETSSCKESVNPETQTGEADKDDDGNQRQILSSEEDRSLFREETRNFVEGILSGIGVKCRLVICGDPHPFILSYTGLTGGSRLVLSTGLARLLEKPELAALVKREAFLLKDSGTKIFSIATFLPFLILSLSNWMVETARELRKHRGTGASFLAGGILFQVYRAAEFFLLFVSRARQAAAVKSVPSEERKILSDALEKAARGFCEPIKAGPTFRKLIYESLRYFFPFDPVRMKNVLTWEKFLGKETPILPLSNLLEKTNPFYRLKGIFSSHPADISGYKETSTEPHDMPWSEKDLSRDLKMLTLPWIMTAVGAGISLAARGYFGIPLIFLGLSMAILTIYFIRTEKKNTPTDLENSHRFKITGKMGDRYFGNNFEAPYYFIKRNENYIPLILRQMGRDEEPLFFLVGEKAKADGVVRTHEIPYMDVRSIITENGKGRGIVSLNIWYRAMLALGIMALGAMIIVVQMGS